MTQPTAAAATQTAPSPAPILRRITIERFRGIEQLVWYPASGVNIILGGGDAGKTTILEAVALLLSPTNTTAVSDTDYWKREYGVEFLIEGIFSLPVGTAVSQQLNPSWPWEWDGKDPKVPSLPEDGSAASQDMVYRARVRGTSDMELAYEVVQPDDSISSFSVALRRGIGLVRLGGEDRNDRDLRLIQGSALDRLLSDTSLRSRLAEKLSDTDVGSVLKQEAKDALGKLDEEFQKRSLPSGLDLGIAGGQGFSVGALIGLTAQHSGVDLPLSSWGAGTRRLSALAIAEKHKVASPITLVDEVERGLEPYRQRDLMKKLEASSSQTFLTTHSTSVLAGSAKASVWYVDAKGKVGPLDSQKIGEFRKSQPETFFSRFAVVAEGPTEKGFVTFLLEKALGGPLEQYGIYVTDGGGNENTVKLLQALSEGGLSFSGFADDEGTFSGTWTELKQKLGALLFRWPSGCIEENVLPAVPEAVRLKLFEDRDGLTGPRLRTLQERLGTPDKDLATVTAAAGEKLLETMIQAAKGCVPDDKKADKEERKRLENHARVWFKSYEGGRELAQKVIELGAWPNLQVQLMPFFNAVREIAKLPPITDLLK
jgi:putative ATP-dependent endonuclease of OLD family